MNVKKMITGLVLSMLLSSGTANADWGDVYYCQMTNFDEITLEGEKKNYKLQKFQFKLDQKTKSMVFGSSSYFENAVSKLREGSFWPNQEYWYANTKFSSTVFQKGKFLEGSVGVKTGLVSISADCDKF